MKTQITGTSPIKNGRFHVDVVETRWGFLTTHRPVVAVVSVGFEVYYADTFESVGIDLWDKVRNAYLHLSKSPAQ